MSLDLGIGQVITLTQLSWDTLQNSIKAGDAYSHLTKELGNLYTVLESLQNRADYRASLLNQENDGVLVRLHGILDECYDMLEDVDRSLSKYNGLSEDRNRVKRLGLKIMFGNTTMKDMPEIRQRVASYASSIQLYLSMLLVNSLGKVEESTRNHMLETKGLRKEFRSFADSQRQNRVREESNRFRDDVTVLTTHPNDDKAVWREFRRKAIRNGYSSAFLDEHMPDLLNYMEKYGQEGASDTPKLQNDKDQGRQRLALPSAGQMHRTTSTPRFPKYGYDADLESCAPHPRRPKSSRELKNMTQNEMKFATRFGSSGGNESSPKEANFGDVNDWLSECQRATGRNSSTKTPDNFRYKPNTSETSKELDRAYIMAKERHREPPIPEYDEADEYDKEEFPWIDLSKRREIKGAILNTRERQTSSPLPEYDEADEYDKERSHKIDRSKRRRANAKKPPLPQRAREVTYPTTRTSGRGNHPDSVHDQNYSARPESPHLKNKSGDPRFIYGNGAYSGPELKEPEDDESTSSEYSDQSSSPEESGDEISLYDSEVEREHVRALKSSKFNQFSPPEEDGDVISLYDSEEERERAKTSKILLKQHTKAISRFFKHRSNPQNSYNI
ncbi:962331f4-e80d-479e-b1e3-afdab6a9f61c [Sclerotinia trifoliorum]|uniref:962331f4-e80d-479e-b1e3-afdab6a9f61c n=1 Tax=Sclerotinia trifoliorum TaxID=28548 RepID=A0A8H2VZ64_9HELO|nr:962331f4-e80d-479e-b1e3-afdab6a9f61c [Sclerotinia trifoliorum]